MTSPVPFPAVEEGVDARELNARLAAALATANGRIEAFSGWYADLIEDYTEGAARQ